MVVFPLLSFLTTKMGTLNKDMRCLECLLNFNFPLLINKKAQTSQDDSDTLPVAA